MGGLESWAATRGPMGVLIVGGLGALVKRPGRAEKGRQARMEQQPPRLLIAKKKGGAQPKEQKKTEKGCSG